MGKSRGKKRQRQRVKEIEGQLERLAEAREEQAQIDSTPLDDLFVVDTAGDAAATQSKGSKKRRKGAIGAIGSGSQSAAKEDDRGAARGRKGFATQLALVNRASQRALVRSQRSSQPSKARNAVLQAAALAVRADGSTHPGTVLTAMEPTMDLWGDDGGVIGPTASVADKVVCAANLRNAEDVRPRPRRQRGRQAPRVLARAAALAKRAGTAAPTMAKVAVAHPGLSINPSVDDYGDLVGAAAARELDRLRQMRNRERFEPGVKEGYGEDLPSDDEAEAERMEAEERKRRRDPEYQRQVAAALAARQPVVNRKRTQAQLNKQKRHQADVEAALRRKQERQFLAAVSEAKAVGRRIEKEERQKAEQKRERARQRAEDLAEQIAELADQPVLMRGHRADEKLSQKLSDFEQVPLREEISGSLRSAPVRMGKPAILDRFGSLAMRDELVVGRKQKRGKAWRKVPNKFRR